MSDSSPEESEQDDEKDSVVFEGHKGVGYGIGPVPKEVREQRQRERENDE